MKLHAIAHWYHCFLPFIFISCKITGVWINIESFYFINAVKPCNYLKHTVFGLDLVTVQAIKAFFILNIIKRGHRKNLVLKNIFKCIVRNLLLKTFIK